MASLTRWKIWFKMMIGKSELHVNQPLGKFISVDEIKGYYNDFTNKVLFDKKTEKIVDYIPLFINDDGKKVVFPITVIQYALGCYELFLETNDDVYLKKMIHCSEYVLSLINADGSISCMYFFKDISNPYSAMCQGECVSLLARAYLETNDKRFFDGALKAFNFLINEDHNQAVVKTFRNLKYCLYEFPDKTIVLNGYIYALFGVYDAYLLFKNPEIKKIFDISSASLLSIIDDFDYNKWSFYDLAGNVSSKFYHKLHVVLLPALNLICNNKFKYWETRWYEGLKDKRLSRKMFWKKVKQKLIRK